MKITSAEYVKSSPNITICPKPDKPEFAFIGRSNVGKSSLINLLVEKHNLARTSGQPGKTIAINHYLINGEWYLVDLPGYGFAKTSKEKRDEWKKMINDYLLQRENLINVFLLIDSNIPPQKKDIEFANFLGEHGIPFSIVFTKADKPTKNHLKQNTLSFRKELLQYWEELPPDFITSGVSKAGRQELLDYIAKCMAGFEGREG